MGVQVKEYHTDNGIFKSQAYVKEIIEKQQKIRYSGVGAKWQNGVAEGGIRIIVSRARTMMIHAALLWPETANDSLWPLAVSHAAHIYNHTPNELNGIAPVEVFTRTVSDGNVLKNLHTWGCPTYVLEPKLTSAGGKIPKWQPRSQRGQYVGVSPSHAENIALVLNNRTGYISPQYHVVFDDWFETIYVDDDHEPSKWEELCMFHRFEVELEPDADPPPLQDEWLTPKEIEIKRAWMKGHSSQRRTSQEMHTKESRDDKYFERPKPKPEPHCDKQSSHQTRSHMAKQGSHLSH